jgi:hypothetical protein
MKTANSEPAQSARRQALSVVEVGDVVFGLGAGGQEKLLLVYKVDAVSIWARHVTTQVEFKFDRDGRTGPLRGGGSCTIVSVAPLPDDEYDVAIGLDRRARTEKDRPQFILTEAEINLILTKGDFYRARPLPRE